MSQMWHRMRGLANPIPAIEPGGIDPNAWDPSGDVTLPDDHFARIHNPANGRVPPQLPSPITRPQWPQFSQTQYERFFINTPGNLARQLGFQAQSVRVDNYSSHWLYFPSIGIYIPPFVYGSVFWLQPGSNVAQYNLQAPLGHVDPGTVVESTVVTMWYEEQLTPVTGFPVPAT
jgi:hypothetical protein